MSQVSSWPLRSSHSSTDSTLASSFTCGAPSKIRARVKRDPGFRKGLLREGLENFLSGDVETGKIILRDFINATVGFTKLSDVTHRSAKSLMRVLGPRGNPEARNLFEIVAYL